MCPKGLSWGGVLSGRAKGVVIAAVRKLFYMVILNVEKIFSVLKKILWTSFFGSLCSQCFSSQSLKPQIYGSDADLLKHIHSLKPQFYHMAADLQKHFNIICPHIISFQISWKISMFKWPCVRNYKLRVYNLHTRRYTLSKNYVQRV